MSSSANARTVLRNPIAPAHFLNGNLAPLQAYDDMPVVFVVGGEISEQESLGGLVRSQGWHLEILASVQELLRRPSTQVPSCLILNSTQDCSILEVGRRFTLHRPEIPIILITSIGDVRMAVEAMKAGATDFFLKPLGNDLLLRAIRESLERSHLALAHQMKMRDLRNRYASLSRRERQVMELVVSGLLNKQVGGELGISEITVKAHRRQVMQKMHANSLAGLVRMAAELPPHRNQIHLA
jgi:FixJ family two-component response regulator